MGSLVSVVVPLFNHERFISDCLHSIVKQTYSEIELIVLDDRSGDRSLETAAQFLQQPLIRRRFKRVIIEQNSRNLGAHATLNRGHSISAGEFVSFINSDDLYRPDRVACLVEQAAQTKANFLFSKLDFIQEEHSGSLSDRILMAQVRARQAAALRGGAGHLLAHLCYSNVCATSGNIFCRSSVFDRLGGFRAFKYCHDWDLMLRAALLGTVSMSNSPTYFYRLHANNSFKALTDLARPESQQIMSDLRLQAEMDASLQVKFGRGLAQCAKKFQGL